MSMNLLSVDNLSVTLRENKQKLVRNVSFSVSSGGKLTLLGQSGSGKTMSCRAILGLLNSHSFQIGGTIDFDGQSLPPLSEGRRKSIYGSQIAFVPQNPMTALDPSRTVGHQMLQFIRLHQSMSVSDARSRYTAALSETGLMQPERILKSFPHQLSGGMLQRVLIALAFAQNVRLILADEPTTALDAVHRDQAVELLCQLQKRGCAVLLVTHDFYVAKQMGGKVLILKEGEAVEQGDIGQVLTIPKADYTRELIDAARLEWR